MPNPGTAIFTKHAGRGRQRDIRTLGRETAVHAESVCISGRLSDNNTRWNPMSTLKTAAQPRQQTTPIKKKSSVIHTFKLEDAITGDLICVCLFVTLSFYCAVHDAVLDLHVSAEVPLQVKLAGAVRALERLAAGVEVHVAEEVVHSVERLPAHLKHNSVTINRGSPLQATSA